MNRTLTPDTPWADDALCRRFPDQRDLWFPPYETPKQTADARAVCSWCPTQRECREFALALTGPHRPKGVWGGTTTRIRAQRATHTTAA